MVYGLPADRNNSGKIFVSRICQFCLFWIWKTSSLQQKKMKKLLNKNNILLFLIGFVYCFRAVLHMQFVIDMVDMLSDCAGGDTQLLGNFFIE